MKRKNILWMLCVVLMLIASVATAQESWDDILMKMDAANTKEALAQSTGRAAYRVNFVYNGGLSYAVRNYFDQEKYVYEEDGYIEIDVGGKVAGCFAEEETYFSQCFVGEEAYAEMQRYRASAWYQYEPIEKVVQVTEENGKLMIETEMTKDALLRQFEANYGYEANDVKRISMHYVVDAQTYEIDQFGGTAEKADGSTCIFIDMHREHGVEEYVIPEKIAEILNGEDTRNLTLIENPETDQEITYTYQVPSGVMCQIILSSDYEQVLYEDAAFTKEWEGSADYTKDLTAYIKKI